MSIGSTEVAKPQTRQFRRRVDKPRLTPDAAIRQGRVATLAWERLRDNDAVIAFLNTHEDALGGRPLDVAISGEAGLAAVIAHLDATHPKG